MEQMSHETRGGVEIYDTSPRNPNPRPFNYHKEESLQQQQQHYNQYYQQQQQSQPPDACSIPSQLQHCSPQVATVSPVAATSSQHQHHHYQHAHTQPHPYPHARLAAAPMTSAEVFSQHQPIYNQTHHQSMQPHRTYHHQASAFQPPLFCPLNNQSSAATTTTDLSSQSSTMPRQQQSLFVNTLRGGGGDLSLGMPMSCDQAAKQSSLGQQLSNLQHQYYQQHNHSHSHNQHQHYNHQAAAFSQRAPNSVGAIAGTINGSPSGNVFSLTQKSPSSILSAAQSFSLGNNNTNCNASPTVTATSSLMGALTTTVAAAVGQTTNLMKANGGETIQWPAQLEMAPAMATKSTTTNQRSKLVESSSSSSASGASSSSSGVSSSSSIPSPHSEFNASSSKSAATTATARAKAKAEAKATAAKTAKSSGHQAAASKAAANGKFKSYLANLVLASNIPFAYAIILVAFLITVIAATSIITILTIALTITGYTAYPITENTFNTSLAIGVVCASLALALVTGLLLLWRRHCQAAYYYLDDPQTGSRGTNSPQLSETYDDSEYGSIAVNDWAKHVQKLHSDGDIGFSKEFEQIQKSSQSNLSYEHSQLIENKHKNRYINIVAYDHTRVTLRPMPGQKKPGSDYINANFIDGYNKPRAYIGTQGPLVSTFDDYWRMIWEQRVVIIVMITNLQERGRLPASQLDGLNAVETNARKCDMYWPKEGTETYGHIQVKLLQEVVMATYTLRTFNAKNLKMKRKIGHERTVYQYHYTNWPDHGVPDHPLPVLSFVKKSAAANPPGAGAIICHCSAGCGRSGTYIVIDAMLKQIRHRESINVVDFLKHIRLQRNYLVQTEEQYVFIHDALVEAIESGDTEIPAKFIGKYIQLLQTGGCQQQQQSLSQKNSNYSIANGFGGPNGLFGAHQQALTVSSESTNQQQMMMVNSQSNLLLATNSGGTATTFQSNCKTTLAGAGAIGSNTTMSGRSSQSVNSAGQWSLLERQYRLVASFKAKDFNVVSALKPCNKIKNRTLNLIPLEAHRVHITPKPGADGSDYINATFLMGFSHLREFIVTQHPVYETFSDFWQMVYDHNSQTIVLLTQMSHDLLKEFPQFWPQKEDEVDYGSFKVKLIGETTLSSNKLGSSSSSAVSASAAAADNNNTGDSLIIQRDFIMRSNQDDYELQTKIIHCAGWPECGGPLGGVFDLIQVVQDATQEQATQQKMHDVGNLAQTTVTVGQEHEPQNGGPIIVVDKFGGTEAATFAVLTTLYKQIKFEAAVDVYMYAKLAHLRRPGIWSSQDDYLFLYRAIENYASNHLLESESSQSATNNRSATPLVSSPAVNFHHHLTMTLDRHRHKSSGGAHSLKSSTMRRAPSSTQKQQQGGGMVTALAPAPATAAGDLSKSNSQLVANHNHNGQYLVDHNHNHIGPVAQQNMTNIGKLQQQRTPASDQTIQHLKALQQQQQQMNNNSNNSPYNSATSIGTSPHQHLLATNGRSFIQQQQQPAGHTADHYLYPMS